MTTKQQLPPEALVRLLERFEQLILDANDEQLPSRAAKPICRELNQVRAKLLAALRANPSSEARAEAWLSITEAPMYVYGLDALVGEWVPGWGWKKVSIWEREWTRDDIIRRGGTHWWPHLRDLPAAILPQNEEKP